MVGRPGRVAPGPHHHDANEEVFLVTEGTMTFLVGDEWIDAPRGTFVRIPPGVTHDFENRSDAPAAAFNVFLPGGFEAPFGRGSNPAMSSGPTRGLSPRTDTEGYVEVAVQASGLVKHYGDVEAVRGVDLRVERGRGLRLPRAQRRRQVDHRADAHDAAVDHLRQRATSRASTSPRDPDAARHRIGVALQEAGLDPRQTGRELLVLQARLFGMSPREAAERRRGAARAGRARGRRRPPHQGLLAAA